LYNEKAIDPMILKNKLNLTDAVELARVEEKLSKSKANTFFKSGF